MPRSRTVVATALTAASLVVAGCGASTPAAKGPMTAQGPNAPFEVWTRSTETTAKVYEAMFKDFEAISGVKVDYKPIFNDFDKQLQQQGMSP